MIRFENVEHWYERSKMKALENFNLTVNEGEFLCLIGPSGCGKSTALNIAGGFVKPKKGSVLIEGRGVTKPGGLVKVIFQEGGLFPWLTALQNVEFGLKMQGLPSEERRRRALEWLAKVGLAGSEYKYPTELSGGMKQRTTIARVMVCDPRVVLMDEPFGALDAQTRKILQEQLLQIWMETKKTILFVTHDVTEAVRLADRIAIMTTAPGVVKKIVEIREGRPRNPETSIRIAMQIEEEITTELQRKAEWAQMESKVVPPPDG